MDNSPLDLILVNVINRYNFGEISNSPQLGVVYIATLCRANGFNVRILAGDDVFPELQHSIRTSPHALVGFYLNSDNFQEVSRLTVALKELAPATRIIVGGPIPNVQGLEGMPNAVDFACSGDGEFLTLDLLSHLGFQIPSLDQISGLSHRTSDGRIKRNPPRDPILDLDQLPIPDRSLYPSHGVGIKGQLVTSRGCGFRCTFCFESTNRRYRAHSPERVLDEMKKLQDQYGTTYFSFVDDIFTQNPKRLRRICELMQKHFRPHRDLFWYCEARVDSLARYQDLIPLMKASGLTRIQIGTESGSQKVIDAYKKHITLEQIYRAVEMRNDSRVLSIFTNFIIGGALEDHRTFSDTLALATTLMDLAPGRLECSTTFLSPYPGTDIARNPGEYNIAILDAQFETGLSDEYIFVETTDLCKLAILELERQFNHVICEKMVNILPSLESSL